MRGSEIRSLALSRVDTALDLSSVGEGELARLSETGLWEIAERDAGTFPAPSKAKEPALVTVGPTRSTRRATAGSTMSNSSPVGASAESFAADILADTRVLRGMAH